MANMHDTSLSITDAEIFCEIYGGPASNKDVPQLEVDLSDSTCDCPLEAIFILPERIVEGALASSEPVSFLEDCSERLLHLANCLQRVASRAEHGIATARTVLNILGNQQDSHLVAAAQRLRT